MRCLAHYEIQSEMSVVSDDIQLKLHHPNGDFEARIKNIVRNDYSNPFLLSVQISLEAPNLNEAKDIASEKLSECLNIIAFVTGGGVRRHKTKQIVDCTPLSGMRECLVWADSFGHEDPQPFLDQNIISSMERLLQFDAPPAVRRALRWYRIGIEECAPDDQFQYFWFALEILAEHEKNSEDVPDKCPRCKTPLYCKTCKANPTHRPYPKQAIRALIQAVDGTCTEETIKSLEEARNGLMHGATLKEIENALPNSEDHIVDILGKILFRALLHQFPKEILKEGIDFGSPTTYVHWTRTGVAHISTVVPTGEDGELDLNLQTGLKVSVATDGEPQSGRPSIIRMTSEQHKQLELLSRQNGDHQSLCKRLCQRAKVANGQVVSLVLSRDVARIRDMLKRGKTGTCPDLFREIMATNQSMQS